MYPQQSIYPQQPQMYAQQPYVVYPQQPQNRIGTAEAVIGGMILGSVLDDILDPE